MVKVVRDQAEGLRRLLAKRPLRIVALLSASQGSGASTAAVNLAAALCHHGKRALVIDEHEELVPGTRGYRAQDAHTGELPFRATLADLVEGRMTLEGAFSGQDGNQTVTVLDAPLGMPIAATIEEQIAAFDGEADLVLIDACMDASGSLSPLAAMANDIVVVMDADAASLTSAYGLIKRLHLVNASQQFRLLFNRVAHPADAQGVYTNLSGVAMRYLGISLTPAGVISRDRDRITRAATLGSSVVSAFPAAPAAIDYRRIAADMLNWPWRPISNRQANSGLARPSFETTPVAHFGEAVHTV
jgi:flagellar biosynthesis protein FlhG